MSKDLEAAMLWRHPSKAGKIQCLFNLRQEALQIMARGNEKGGWERSDILHSIAER
jgi:hypothetical protein